MQYNRLKTKKEFHYNDYHHWYEIFDEKKDIDSFLGFELNGDKISRYEPLGISWDDSFCRNLDGTFGCFVEDKNVVLTDEMERQCENKFCNFFKWGECDIGLVSKDLDISTCPVEIVETLQVPPDLRIDIGIVSLAGSLKIFA